MQRLWRNVKMAHNKDERMRAGNRTEKTQDGNKARSEKEAIQEPRDPAIIIHTRTKSAMCVPMFCTVIVRRCEARRKRGRDSYTAQLQSSRKGFRLKA